MEKLDVVNAALGALKAGKTCELVVVAGTAGSSPRGVGAWMAVFADGSQAGTIGGGKIELFALNEARELLAAGQSRLVRYTMGGENSDTGMICGGAICLCYLHLDVSQVLLFQSVADVLAYRRIGDFVIDFEPFIANALEGDVAEYHGGASRHTIAGCPELSLVEEGSKVTYTNAASEIPPAHIETLCPEGLTYIFGCGHVGAATARVLTAAGFAVVACDDRPGTLTPEWVPGVYDRRLVDYKNLSKQCPIGPRDLVVVATAGHKSDIDVVIQAMRAKPAYLAAWARAARRPLCAPVWSRRLYAGPDRRAAPADRRCHRGRGSRGDCHLHRRRDDPPAPHQTRPPQALVASPSISCGEMRAV